jgi:hypothetical protein
MKSPGLNDIAFDLDIFCIKLFCYSFILVTKTQTFIEDCYITQSRDMECGVE